ncbi:MAG: nuclear transport factor 2 family protein [Caldimonas sp.]
MNRVSKPAASSESRWVEDLFAAIDRKDASAFVAFLSPEASLRFANQAPVRGRDAIGESIAGLFAALHELQHRVEDRWSVPGALVVTGNVTYVRHDGSSLCVPFANVMKVRDERIYDYQIFVDNSALFAT